jgi:UDP-GlcNAc3NAcA epimerase
VGARPQFIKAAALSGVLRERHREILVHTGQHYDRALSGNFFEELDIPAPDYELGVGSGSHARQTAQMLLGIEDVIEKERPDWVLVYGDTNSTLAGALAAVKLHVPVAHVEAGLRSFNRAMPEEVNRVITDQVSDMLFCPSQTAADNLKREGVIHHVHVVGDVMAEALRQFGGVTPQAGSMVDRLQLSAGKYLLATVHRAENTDSHDRLTAIVRGLEQLAETVVLPAHPRLRDALVRHGLTPEGVVRVIEPVGYADMVALERNARVILTDSGGIQKEAYWLGVPCITLRDETEWVETVEAGWNVLTGAHTAAIINAVRSFRPPASRPALYGEGDVAQSIVTHLSASR